MHQVTGHKGRFRIIGVKPNNRSRLNQLLLSRRDSTGFRQPRQFLYKLHFPDALHIPKIASHAGIIKALQGTSRIHVRLWIVQFMHDETVGT